MRNQCDGCAANAPMRNLTGKGVGVHVMPSGGLMGCTADLYGHPHAVNKEPLITAVYNRLRSLKPVLPTVVKPKDKPRCRDCADFGPVCPNSGKRCDGK